MDTITKQYYLDLGLTEEDILALNDELSLTPGPKQTKFARSRRSEMLKRHYYFPRGQVKKTGL